MLEDVKKILKNLQVWDTKGDQFSEAEHEQFRNGFKCAVGMIENRIDELHPTQVVNLRKKYFDVYIGRRNASRGLPESPFHNPFKSTDYPHSDPAIQRVYVVVAFAQYFYTKIQEEPDFQKKVLALRGKKLGCWCKPKLCHGDVIAHYVDVVSKDVIL